MCQIIPNVVSDASKVVFPQNPTTTCPTRLAQLLNEYLTQQGEVVGCTAKQQLSTVCQSAIKLAAQTEADRRQKLSQAA